MIDLLFDLILFLRTQKRVGFCLLVGYIKGMADTRHLLLSQLTALYEENSRVVCHCNINLFDKESD